MYISQQREKELSCFGRRLISYLFSIFITQKGEIGGDGRWDKVVCHSYTFWRPASWRRTELHFLPINQLHWDVYLRTRKKCGRNRYTERSIIFKTMTNKETTMSPLARSLARFRTTNKIIIRDIFICLKNHDNVFLCQRTKVQKVAAASVQHINTINMRL